MAPASCGGDGLASANRWPSFDKVYRRRVYKRPRVDGAAVTPLPAPATGKDEVVEGHVKFKVSAWSKIEIRGLRRRLDAELERVRDLLGSVEPLPTLPEKSPAAVPPPETAPAPAVGIETPSVEAAAGKDALFSPGATVSTAEVISPGTPAGRLQIVAPVLPDSPANRPEFGIPDTTASPETNHRRLEMELATAETTDPKKDVDLEVPAGQVEIADSIVGDHRADTTGDIETPADVPDAAISGTEMVCADAVKTAVADEVETAVAVETVVREQPEIGVELGAAAHGLETAISEAKTLCDNTMVPQEVPQMATVETVSHDTAAAPETQDRLPEISMEMEKIESVPAETQDDLPKIVLEKVEPVRPETQDRLPETSMDMEKIESVPAETQDDLPKNVMDKVEPVPHETHDDVPKVIVEKIEPDIAEQVHRPAIISVMEMVSPDVTTTAMQVDKPTMFITTEETIDIDTNTSMAMEADQSQTDTMDLETSMAVQVDRQEKTTSTTETMAPDAAASVATQAPRSHSSLSMVKNIGEDNAVLRAPLLRLPKITISLSETTAAAGFASPVMEKEKRTPKANQFYRKSEFLLGKEKLRLTQESNKKSKSNWKGSRQPAVLDRPTAHAFKQCLNLVTKLIKHRFGWVFDKPVDVVGLGLHDYYDIIKYPMDLGTVKSRLQKNWYRLPGEFAADVRLTFHNAMTYNPENQDVHVLAKQLLNIFEEKWSDIQLEFSCNRRLESGYGVGPPTYMMKKTKTRAPPPEPRRTYDYSEPAYAPPERKVQMVTLTPSGRFVAPKKPKANEPNKRDMTYHEKQKLGDNLLELPPEKQEHVIQVLQRRNKEVQQQDDGIEVDIDSFDAETLWELDRLVSNYKKSLSKIRRRAEMARAKREALLQNTNPRPAYAEALEGNRSDANGASHLPAQGETNGDMGRISTSSSSSSDSDSSSNSDSDSSSGDSDGEHSQKA